MRKLTFDVSVFQDRRRRVGQKISGCALVLPAWPEFIRNHDSHHPYRQESNLLYMTGCDEPQSVFVFRPGFQPETVLFVRPKDAHSELWDGFRYGPDLAKQAFGVDEAYSIDEFEKRVPELLLDTEAIYYTLFKNPAFDQRMNQVLARMKALRPRLGGGYPEIRDAYGLLGEFRIKKTSEEIEVMRQVCEISARAHLAVMEACRPGLSERALHGIFLKSVMEQGASGEAYGSIVAGGANATCLHYRFNENVLQDGDLLLIDAGAEYKFYSGDITRTYPVGKNFKPAQKRLYDRVLDVHKRVLQMVKPGVPHGDLQKATISWLTDVMLEEGLVKGRKEEVIETGAYKRYYPHGVSHMLGLDTHDAGALLVRGESRPMEAGWVFTIEPGLYVPMSDTNAPAELRGVGIRIEDDVLVTETGAEVLTELAPKNWPTRVLMS